MNSTMPLNTVSRERGRPREFDIEAALDSAILYFREHGYNGVSIADLSEALKLSAGSIYKAFHSKHALFSAALDRYIMLRTQRLTEIIESANSGREKLHRLLVSYAESSYSSEGKYGCLVVVGAVELSSTDDAIAAKVASALNSNELRLVNIIKQGLSDGSIAQTIDPEITAKHMLALIQGMRVLGKVGQEREAMVAVINTAMKILN